MTTLDRSLVNGSTIAVGVTGLAYAAFQHLLVNDDPFSAVNHPLQPWALRLHVLAAPVLVFAIGAIFKEHVLAKYRNGAMKAARRTGVALLAALLPATLTGYLLPVVVSGSAHDAVAWAHIGFGVALLIVHGGHLLLVPARKERDAAGAREPSAGGVRIGRPGAAAR